MTIIINWVSFWLSFLKRLLLTNCFLFCLWSDFIFLKWDFVFTAFICRIVFFTILRLATSTFLRTIFLRKYSCKTNKKLFARKLFDINSSHCFSRISRYAINWAIDWLFRWWSSLIFCSTIVIQSLIKLICFFRKSQNCFQNKTNFVVSSNRNRYLCHSQSRS